MVHTQGYVVHNCGRGLVHGLEGIFGACTKYTWLRPQRSKYVAMWRTTWSLRGSYPLVTWPATLVSRGRHAERALECNSPICAPKKDASTPPPGSAGVQRGRISAARAQFPFKPASVTNPMHISSANLTPSATPATPSDATYTMPKL